MRLDEYLDLVGLPAYKFADQNGIDRESVYQVLRGRAQELRLKTVVAILNGARGMVTAQELLLPSPKFLAKQESRKRRKEVVNGIHQGNQSRCLVCGMARTVAEIAVGGDAIRICKSCLTEAASAIDRAVLRTDGDDDGYHD